MLHQTIEKLHALKLSAMADGLLAQSRQPGIEALDFEERLALLVDVQHTAAYNAALGQRLKAANLRQTACLEDLDLRTPRGLLRHPDLTGYALPTALDAPDIRIVKLVEERDVVAPFGAKAVSAVPVVTSPAAVASAVRAATGRPVNRLPIRPQAAVVTGQ